MWESMGFTCLLCSLLCLVLPQSPRSFRRLCETMIRAGGTCFFLRGKFTGKKTALASVMTGELQANCNKRHNAASREWARMLVAEHGYKRVAWWLGIKEGTLRQWASRYRWQNEARAWLRLHRAEIRFLSYGLPLNQIAIRFNLSYARVRKWSSRGKWDVRRRGPVRSQKLLRRIRAGGLQFTED